MQAAPTSTNQEDYLEQIDVLIAEKGYARVSDIAERLKLGRPSVSAMIQHLDRLGHVNYERYRGITLTETGREIAGRIRERHALLEELFEALALDPQTHLADIEGIEHHISEGTLQQFRALLAHLKKHPLPKHP